MRRRRVVVLLARTPNEASDWKVRLDLQPGVRMLTAASLSDALQLLRSNADVALVMTSVVGNLGIDALRMLVDPSCKVLLFGCSPEAAAATRADAWEVDGPALPGRVLARVKILMARKRGPLSRAVMSEAAQRRESAAAVRKEAA